MKNLIRKISALLFSATVFTTVFAAALPVSAENEDTGTYISALSGFALTKEDPKSSWSMDNVDFQKNVNMLEERNYSALWFDFNQEAYNGEAINVPGDNESYYRYAPLAIGYQTTTDRKEAITDIVISYDENPDATIEFNSITYSLMGGWEFENEIIWVDGLDLNRFTKGEYIYLYYTKDAKAGEPIKALKGSNSGTEPNYECALSMSGNTADLNSGSYKSNSCATYLHFQRDASTTGSVFGGGNTTLIIIAVSAVAVVGVVLVIVFKKKKES